VDNTAVVVAVVAAIPGLIAGIVAILRSRTSSAKELTNGAIGLLRQYRERADEYEAEISAMQNRISVLESKVKALEQDLAASAKRIEMLTKENGHLKVGVEILTEQVISLGGEPRFIIK